MKAMPALKRAVKSKGSTIPRLDSFGQPHSLFALIVNSSETHNAAVFSNEEAHLLHICDKDVAVAHCYLDSQLQTLREIGLGVATVLTCRHYQVHHNLALNTTRQAILAPAM